MTSSCPLRKVPDGEFRRSDFCYVLLGEPSDAFESGLQLPLKLCHLRMPLCIVFYVAICVAWRCRWRRKKRCKEACTWILALKRTRAFENGFGIISASQ